MLFVRFVILFVVVGIVFARSDQRKCIFECADRRPRAQCAYNGRCTFKFESRCDLDYFNCQYTEVFNRFFPLWTDVCGNSMYPSCPTFYDTQKHKYFPLSLYSLWEFYPNSQRI